MALNKKKATVVNMIIMAIYQIVTIIVGFIIPKIFLSTYGAEFHGYTSTVNTIMNYIALLNAGLASAAVQSLYAPLAKKNKYEISCVLNAIDKMYIKTGIYYLLAIFICAFVLPCIINTNISKIDVFLLMIIMGATNTMECFIYSKYRVLLQADQRLYIVTLGDIFALILRSILQIYLINLYVPVVVVQSIPLGMVFVRMAIVSVYVRRNYNLDRKAPARFEALSKRKSAFIHQIAALVVNNTDILILTLKGSLVSVSIYSVYNLVCSHMNSLLSYIFSHSIVASFGQLLNENKKEKLLKNFRFYEYVYFLIITIIFSVTADMLYLFVYLYTSSMKDIRYADIILVVLFVIVGVVNNIRIPCLTMINAAGMFKETQTNAIIEAILNISVSLVLVNFIGIYGLLIGTIVSFLYRTLDIIFFTNKNILNESAKVSIFRVIRVVFLIIINVLISNKLINLDGIYSWIDWIIKATEVTILISSISIIFNIITDFKEIKEVIGMFIRKRTK